MMASLPEHGGSSLLCEVESLYISAGCNCVAHTVSWSASGLVAFGARNSVAIYDPKVVRILQMLPGHSHQVNCVEWLPRINLHVQGIIKWESEYLLSGSAGGEIIAWRHHAANGRWAEAAHNTTAHAGAVTCITAVTLSSNTAAVVSSSSDSTLRLWSANCQGECLGMELVQTIAMGPSIMQCVTLAPLLEEEGQTGAAQRLILAAGGLDNHIHLYSGCLSGLLLPVCQLKGHQDWIRCLDFTFSNVGANGGDALYLASSSQDRNVCVWCIAPQATVTQGNGGPIEDRALAWDTATGLSVDTTAVASASARVRSKSAAKKQGQEASLGRSETDGGGELSLGMFARGPTFLVGIRTWQASLEALLVGHEDWVHSVKWQPLGAAKSWAGGLDGMQLLSASMDRRMMVWRPDETSGLWLSNVCVGELGNSVLGFLGGLWSPDGNAILAHAWGGSLHLWQRRLVPDGQDKMEEENEGCWTPHLTPLGHSKPVTDLCWDWSGELLLSASEDQTVRIAACWVIAPPEGGIHLSGVNEGGYRGQGGWHEAARSQVHGHDLRCAMWVNGGDNVGALQYVSGAEEKVARVFQAPSAFLDTLAYTTAANAITNALSLVPDGNGMCSSGKFSKATPFVGAAMSALGLSQKPVHADEAGTIDGDVTWGPGRRELFEPFGFAPEVVPAMLSEPPLEEHLAQNTLWPELQKLYGHGNEVFCMTSDHAGRIIATACKAQTEMMAEVWLWEVGSWKALQQLRAHTLTVTQMEFSPDDSQLLCVSRDRHLSLSCLCPSEGDVNSGSQYEVAVRVEAHKRIVWACSWEPTRCSFFATGSRDKTVKVWEVRDKGLDGTSNQVQRKDASVCIAQALPPFPSGVTALAFCPTAPGAPGLSLLAIGLDDGMIEFWSGTIPGPSGAENARQLALALRFDTFLSHVGTVNRLRWRQGVSYPMAPEKDEENPASLPAKVIQLASCAADHSVRLFSVSIKEG